MDKYKYLGLWLDQKLTVAPQLQHIRKKSYFVSRQLSPFLGKISLDYRMNLWTVFIRPLFDQIMGILYAERNHANPKKVRTLLRMTFKSFTLLPSNTENKVIDRLMKYNIDERAAYMIEKNSIKWDARKERKAPDYQRMI